MTKGEVSTTAAQPANTAAEQKPAADTNAAPAAREENSAKMTAPQPAAAPVAATVAAAAAVEAEAPAAPAPVELAAVEAAPAKPAKAERAAKKDADEDKDEQAAEEAPVDLALAPEVEMLEAIAAADGGRAMAETDAESASLLGGDDDDGGFLIPLLALIAVGAGIAVLLGDDDDADDFVPPPNQAPNITSGATATVAENSGADTVIYTAAATDPEGDTITFSLSGADAGLFTINPATGQLRLNAPADFETRTTYNINIVATDSEGDTDTQAVVVTVTDVADQGPTFTSAATASVAENAGADATVTTVVATDPDGGAVTFTLSGADAGLFTINPATGALTLNDSADFETDATLNVTVTATDNEGQTATQNLVVNVTDVNDEGPVFTSPATADIDENAGADATVLTAVATDPDGGTVTFSLSGEDAAAFTIDAQTGELTLNESADFETDGTLNVNIIATDDEGDTTSQAVVVTVNDLDDSSPVVSSGGTASVDENAGADAAVTTVVATDPDGGAVTFSLSGEDAARFTIDAQTGELTLNESADFETDPTLNVNVIVTDDEGDTTTQAIVVSVNDLDDGAPVFTSPATADVDENAGADAAVTTAVATDPDGGTVTFSLSGEDAAAFTIDAQTGELTLNESADFETDAVLNVNIIATDDEGDTTTQALTVNVNDLADGAPVFTSPTTATVAENAGADAAVMTAVATDPDGGAVTFSLIGADAAAFTINATTGVITLNESADFETDPLLEFTIVATDDEGTSTQQDVSVSVSDVVEGPTQVLLDNEDDDGNSATAVTISAAGDDFLFVEDETVGSFTIITGFDDGDIIQFDAGVEVSFGTSADDANDLQIIVNNGGVVSEIILDDVLADGAGFVFDEATAEAQVGFDFFQAAAAAAPVMTDVNTFA